MTGRNDACPCGSGKKYKHCCKSTDRASLTDDADAAVGRLKLPADVRAAAAQASSWQVDAVPVAVSIETERDARPVVILVVADGYLLHSRLRGRLGGEPEQVAAALEAGIVAAARAVGSYPPVVDVRHADVAPLLMERLLPRSVAVRTGEELLDLRQVALSLLEEIAGHASWPPPGSAETWSAWGLPRPLIAQLFAAAASYWRAAPWKIAGNMQAPRVQVPGSQAWTAGVLGNGGQEFGLVLYSDELDLHRMPGDDGNAYPFAALRGRVLSLTFNAPSEIPKAMRQEIMRAGWLLADPRAVPLLFTINTPGGGLSQREARDLTALLEAVPRFVARYRRELLQENRTLRPVRRLEWRDPASQIAFEYDGVKSAWRAAQADPDRDWDAEADALADEQGQLDLGLGELRSTIEEVAAQLNPGMDPDTALREVNRRVRERTKAWNTDPQPELGNLSPTQVHRLLTSNWSDPESAIRLNRDLSFDQLQHSTLLHNTRVLLELADREDGLLATQAGYLRLAVVRELIEGLRLEPAARAHYLEEKRLTEMDVWPLHRVRILAGLAGLLVLRKGRFETTRKGRTLLAPARAGQLYALLFETALRRMNLAMYHPVGPDWSDLQSQIAFTLFALRDAPNEWRTVPDLLEQTVLPFVLEQAPTSPYFDQPTSLFERRVLDVLFDFGLLEKQRADDERDRPTMYRRLPLYQHFLTFAF